MILSQENVESRINCACSRLNDFRGINVTFPDIQVRINITNSIGAYIIYALAKCTTQCFPLLKSFSICEEKVFDSTRALGHANAQKSSDTERLRAIPKRYRV